MQVTGSMQGTGFIPDALPHETPPSIALRSVSRGGGA
jgi:hypothetical protein